MIVGFCTSCMNRRWQLEQTLPANLELLRGTRHFLALVDYNSGDDLGSFLRILLDVERQQRFRCHLDFQNAEVEI
jgi:hypothetical protein